MKVFNKILLVFIVIFIPLVLSSCGEKQDDAPGAELIKSAKEAYEKLDSARLVIKDCDSGEVKQEFIFRYEGNVLTYSFKSVSSSGVYCEYNDGKSLQIENGGEVKTYKWPSGNFKKYKRSKTHPNASGGIFFYEPSCISKVSVNPSGDGTMVDYEYDVKSLSKKMQTSTSEGKMTAFQTRYIFDGDGNFSMLYETSTFGDAVHTYTIEILDKNAVEKVENPIVSNAQK